MKSGRLEEITIAEILRALYQEHTDGVLTVRQGEAEKQIYFAYGSPIFATSNQREDRMGSILYSQGKVSRENLVRAIDTTKTTGKRFGTVLVELGIISPEELVQTVFVQVEAIILSLFAWEEGTFEFQDGPVSTEEIVALNLNPILLICKGVRENFSMTQVDRFLGNLDQVLYSNSDPDYLYSELNQIPIFVEIIAQLNGEKTIADLLQATPASPEEILRALVALKILGSALDHPPSELPAGESPAPPPEEEAPGSGLDELLAEDVNQTNFREEVVNLFNRLASANYYEILGLTRKAGKNEIVQSYSDLSRKFHPDQFRNQELRDLAEKAFEIFNRITVAYTTLTNERTREEYNHSMEKERIQNLFSDDSLDPSEARRQYERGMILYQEGDMRGALKAFDLAASIDPSVSDYYTGLGLLQTMEIDGKSPNITEAERMFKKAISLKPEEARNYFYLGQIYKSREEYTLAREYLRKALEKRPNYAQAKSELKKVENL